MMIMWCLPGDPRPLQLRRPGSPGEREPIYASSPNASRRIRDCSVGRCRPHQKWILRPDSLHSHGAPLQTAATKGYVRAYLSAFPDKGGAPDQNGPPIEAANQVQQVRNKVKRA